MNRVLTMVNVIPKICMRQLSVTHTKSVKPNITRMKKKQMHFQMDNDVPIYLKGGAMDYVLYYSTGALVLIGMAAMFHSTYKLATQK